MGQEIQVPLAYDADGYLVRPDQAQKHIRYRCLSCGGEIYVRGGTRVLHFWHHAMPEDCEFSYETEEHFLAKLRIQQAVEEHLDIGFRRSCRGCGGDFVQSFSKVAVHATLEFKLPSGRRADVALIGESGDVVGIIEVFATHAVDSVKAADIAGLPWVEVSAEDVLTKDNWRPRQDHWGRGICPTCQGNPLRPRRFEGVGRKEVYCPKDQLHHTAVRHCMWCKLLVNVTREGVICKGGQADDNQ